MDHFAGSKLEPIGVDATLTENTTILQIKHIRRGAVGLDADGGSITIRGEYHHMGKPLAIKFHVRLQLVVSVSETASNPSPSVVRYQICKDVVKHWKCSDIDGLL